MPRNAERPPGLLLALWLSFVRFVASLFARSPSLPVPVTATPTSPSVRVLAHTPLKRPSPVSSSTRSRSPTPTRIFHPPASPFSNISLSGLFATPPLPPDVEPGTSPVLSPPSPSSHRASHGASTSSFHSLPSRSPRTPRTPSSAVSVQLDRSAISPTTMSDGSLEVISLGDPPACPLKLVGPLPSPWSPVGKPAPSDVWMSVDGVLMNAVGPIVDDDAATTLSVPRISTASLCPSPSALDAFGISVFLDKDDPSNLPEPNQALDENHPSLVTPCKRRDTLPSVTSHATTHSSRSVKYFSTPLTKLDSVSVSHVRSATSVSSMAYELRMGLFADGRSMSAFENIISLLDQASPESTRTTPHRDAMQAVVAG